MKIRPIHFVHRGRIVSVDSSAPDRTVLEWLREDAHCTGTKEGCAEGDCGACTVIVAELDPESNPARADGLRLQAINSCIRFLPTLDGKALITVEDLACGQDLHPVQQAMVNCHAAQCGFCTPGIVMSLTAGYERHCEAGTLPSRRQVADDIVSMRHAHAGHDPIAIVHLLRFLHGPKACVEDHAMRLPRAGLFAQLNHTENVKSPPLSAAESLSSINERPSSTSDFPCAPPPSFASPTTLMRAYTASRGQVSAMQDDDKVTNRRRCFMAWMCFAALPRLRVNFWFQVKF
jgi:xanthine dehydrogenase small subunit